MDIVEKILKINHREILSLLNDDDSDSEPISQDDIEKDKKYHES
jgi:hypothetical protein